MSTEGLNQLPYATGKSLRVFGKIRERCEDFQVDEEPAYAPMGTGDHLFVRFEKTGLNTQDAVRTLAHALGCDPREAGYAGLKDRRAVTTQWASFFRGDAAAALALQLPDMRVLEAIPHPHKLRTGHLRGNRFRIRVLGVKADELGTARAVLDQLVADGAPNYYGEQRFGHGAQNLANALRWLRDGGPAPRDRFARKLQVSTWQSSLFNLWLSARVERGELGTAIAGDLMRKEDTGGMFAATDVADAQARTTAWEISPTGPMFGLRMRWPELEAERIERALWAEHGVPEAALSRLSGLADGTRRVARVRPGNLELEAEPDGLIVGFTLPKGAYATVILRELLKPTEVEAES